MIDGINSANSYRNQWAAQLSRASDTESGDTVEDTQSTGQVWNAVFTDEKTNGVSVDDFLNLMVAQLRNQDFMNPVDDTQYVTQLAQFATMQQMQELASYMKTNYVLSLVGKNVTAARFSVSGELQQETGQVEKVSLVNNEYAIYVNGKQFTLEQIMEINSTASSGSTGSAQEETPPSQEYLLSLLGREVTVQKRNEEGEPDGTLIGTVDRVSTKDGKFQILVDGAWYPLEDVIEVGGTEETEEPGDVTEPEEPGDVTEPEEPGDVTKPEEPGSVTEPEEPGDVTEPENPGGVTEPEEPSDVTEPEQPESSGGPGDNQTAE